MSIQRSLSFCNFDIKPVKRYNSALKSTQIKFENAFNAINKGLKICGDEKVHIQQMIQTSLNVLSIRKVADELLLVLKNKLSEQFDVLEYNLESVGNHISGYARPISVSLYCIGGFLIAMLSIASLVIARLLYRTFRDKLYVDQDDFFVGELNYCDVEHYFFIKSYLFLL